jgi:hypothetical protein
VVCTSCGFSFDLKSARIEQIVESNVTPRRGWKPLVVGEDVDRYAVTPSRIIRINVAGINYKSQEVFEKRKILIRKTGVGIKAAIDESGALTNQVVFHYRLDPKWKAPSFLLDYFLGVLCSRVLLAYHLKRFGENEWRSHPYVTQRIISELPIPDVREGTWQWRQARAIAEAAARRRKRSSRYILDDLMVDRLVAGLYGLSERDCGWVLKVLDSAQALEPIRSLRVNDPHSLRPIKV